MSLNRRGFFSLFKRRGEFFFFGLQIAANVFGEDESRRTLHRVLSEGTDTETPEQKRSFYRRISAVLLENAPFIEYGYWDYLTNEKDAEAEFEDWVNELEGGIAIEEEELGEAIDEMHRLSSDKGYLVVTVVFLLESVEANQNVIEEIESIPEEEYFSKASFQKLIETISYIDFEYSMGDAAFIMPGNEDDGISWEDLHSEGWNYLKPVM